MYTPAGEFRRFNGFESINVLGTGSICKITTSFNSFILLLGMFVKTNSYILQIVTHILYLKETGHSSPLFFYSIIYDI